MNRAKLSAKGLLLISGIGVAAAALAGPAFAAVQASSGTSTPTTVVIRGSDPAAAELIRRGPSLIKRNAAGPNGLPAAF